MANRIESLPLTAYDVIGYFIPGLVVVVSALALLHGSSSFDIKISLDDGIKVYYIVVLMIVIVFSYVTGHVVALLSAIFVEKLVIYVYGYPSQFLFHSLYSIARPARCRIFIGLWKNICAGNFLRGTCIFFVCIVFFPQLFVMFLLDVVGIGDSVNRSIPRAVAALFFERFRSIFKCDAGDLKSDEWFFMAQQYILLNSQHAALRMYNYLNLYGFCRNMAFVCTICGFLFIMLGSVYGNSRHYVPWSIIFISFGVFLTFAFIKFYRRYSLEVVMSVCVSRAE